MGEGVCRGCSVGSYVTAMLAVCGKLHVYVNSDVLYAQLNASKYHHILCKFSIDDRLFPYGAETVAAGKLSMNNMYRIASKLRLSIKRAYHATVDYVYMVVEICVHYSFGLHYLPLIPRYVSPYVLFKFEKFTT